jgi:outer membrane receptor protein involved in Fe transport
MPSIAKSGFGIAALFLGVLPAPGLADDQSLETVVVIGNAPLPGSGIDADKVPGEVQTISIPDLTRDRQTDVLANAVASQSAGVSLTDEQGSQFQPDFVYRGFEASPISGIAEGVAVYQDGVRLNESFGDNVNWDLVPQFAVRSLTLQSNDPAFGLNTMGGAVTLSMKSGLDFQGADAQLSGGSFGNVTGNVEYGAQFGDVGVYLGVGSVHDDGFRYRSPTTLRQGYGDVGYETGTLTLHLSATAALNDIAAVGPTPVEMLAQDPKSVFTFPQAIRNEMEMTQLRGTWHASDAMTFSASTYYRHYLQHLTDGNTTDVDYCENDPTQLCLEGDGNFPGDALYDNHGNPVSASVLPAGATPGETDFTRTNTNGYGATAQVALTQPLFGHANNLVVGASVDRGTTNYTAFGELGTLEDNLEVVGVGVIIDQGLSPTASPPIEEPVNVDGTNTYTGLYAIDVFDVTPALSWTVSGRLNVAEIQLRDRLGTALNGDHHFSHFNPGTGLTYKITDRITAYAGYSQSNRTPTAGELSCADPASPCLLDAFLVSDPSLKQVVSFNYEAGLRGNFQLGLPPGSFAWSAGAYRTDATNDILLLSTDINGFGFFHNAGTTRHQGFDLHLGYREARWSFNASYSYLDATFQSFQALSSDSPAADADGLIFVHPGDHLPVNPANRLTLSADYTVTPLWRVGADLRAQSGQYLVGDESNQEGKLPGFATVDLHTDYKLGDHLELFAEADNLFDKRYYTYGAFTELDGLPPNFDLTNPRTYSPNPGRTVFIGMRAQVE